MATPTWITLANSNQASQVASASAVSNFTGTLTAPAWVSPGGSVPGQAFQVQADQMYPGQMWRFTANGIWSTTSCPGLSLGVYYGASPICYASCGAGSAGTNNASVPWYLQAVGRVITVGSVAGTWQVVGMLTGLYNAGANVDAGTTMMPQYTTAAQYDTATTTTIALGACCSAPSSSNAVTTYSWAVEYMTEQ